MIFITGGTGFIGSALINRLSSWNRSMRILMPPSEKNFLLPKNIPLEIAVSNLYDPKNLRAALKDVDIIIHLASDENRGTHADLLSVDIQGTASLVQVAAETQVKHIVYISHLGAEPSSAYPLLKAKGQAENVIVQSNIPYTIFKTGPVYGYNDHFIDRLQRYISLFPFFVFLPDKGQNLLHPLHIDDMISSLLLCLDGEQFINQTYQLGGPEYISFHALCAALIQQMHVKKSLISIPGNTIRSSLLFIEQIWKNLPFSALDLDYLAMDRIASLDTLPRNFGILPTRLQTYLETL